MAHNLIRIEQAAAVVDVNDPTAYATLSASKQATVQAWIRRAIAPGTGRTSAGRMSSYGLKHLFERSAPVGFYMTNGQFKGAMCAAGYEPRDPAALNWQFRIEVRHPLHIAASAATA